MSGGREPILFEAVCTPPAGLSDRGMRWLIGLALGAAILPGVAFAILGAWPVLGFLGVEVVAVLGLVALHRLWRRRSVETVLLTGQRLSVRRSDGRGGTEQVELEPYWTRIELIERGEAVPLLTAHARGQSVELGKFLAEAEKRDLAAALEDALRSYRNPRFDNPQLRE
jgi:uncharacterized membrane protein